MPIRPSRPSPFDCAQGRFYDAAGRRVRATVDGVTTNYPFEHYEVTGTTIRKYYALGGPRVAMRTAGALSYLLTDHLGSTAVTTDAAGAKAGELRYLPFGATRTTWGLIPTDRRFTGQPRYATLELDYFGARWHDTALGRFAQADTIRAGAGESVPRGLPAVTGAQSVQLCAQQPAQVPRSQWACAGMWSECPGWGDVVIMTPGIG